MLIPQTVTSTHECRAHVVLYASTRLRSRDNRQCHTDEHREKLLGTTLRLEKEATHELLSKMHNDLLTSSKEERSLPHQGGSFHHCGRRWQGEDTQRTIRLDFETGLCPWWTWHRFGAQDGDVKVPNRVGTYVTKKVSPELALGHDQRPLLHEARNNDGGQRTTVQKRRQHENTDCDTKWCTCKDTTGESSFTAQHGS